MRVIRAEVEMLENEEKRRNTRVDRALLSIRQDGERQLARCFAAMGRGVPPEESQGSRAPGGGSASEDSFSAVSSFIFSSKHASMRSRIDNNSNCNSYIIDLSPDCIKSHHYYPMQNFFRIYCISIFAAVLAPVS